MTSTAATINFSHAMYEVRPAFSETHSLYWARLARPGAWWTGAERVAIAAESRVARNCSLCADRQEALSPSAVPGSHTTAGDILPQPAIEAIHRLVTDASRISKPWLDTLYEQELSDGQYVELLGTVVAVLSIDSFCLAIGVTPHAFPEPVTGEISRYRPSNLDHDTAFVPMLDRDLDGTPEEGLWGRMAPNVYRAMSLVPDEVRNMLSLSSAHYPDGPGVDAVADSALTRPQTELLAARVSALNECFY